MYCSQLWRDVCREEARKPRWKIAFPLREFLPSPNYNPLLICHYTFTHVLAGKPYGKP